MKDVGIVVVTYNRLQLLREVIEALRLQTYKDFQIVVVNNGSTDGTLDWLREQKDIITISQGNYGGAGGFHTGMKYVAENGYKYCWVMDDDVICSTTALEELLKAIVVRDNIGFVCSNVLGINGQPMNTPTPAEKSMVDDEYSDVFMLVKDYAMVRLDMATFVSVLVPVKVIIEVGLPYREFFIWGDDSEYTLRISTKYPSYVVCKSMVVHKRSLQAPLSFFTEPDMKRLKNYFYMFRNNAFVRLKYGKRGKLAEVFTFIKGFASLILHFDFRRLNIYCKGYFALLTFNPRVVFPNEADH